MPSGIPPGPSYPSWIQSVGFWTRPLAFLERCRARYGKRFTIRLPLAPPFVMISDPDEVKRVFTAPPDVLHPGEGARVLEPVVGTNSVLLLDEAAHLEQRKLMLPAFHGEKMERLSDLIAEVADREVASWPRGEPFRLGPRLQRLTMEIILRVVFGLDPGERLDALRERLSAVLAFGDRPISLLPPPPGRLQAILERHGPFASFVRLQEQADALLFELIDERRGEHAERDDILSLLLEARHEDGSPMSSQELRDELMTLLIAGHETTATLITTAVEAMLGDHALRDRLAAAESEELRAAIEEFLRWGSPIAQAPLRFAAEDVEFDGVVVPRGAMVMVSLAAANHDPARFERPDDYEELRDTTGHLAFGHGLHFCLGASLARLEAEVALRTLLDRFPAFVAGSDVPLVRRRSVLVNAWARLPVVLAPEAVDASA